MGHATSFSHIETLDTSGTVTYSDWFDTGRAVELYAYVDSTETGSPDSESIAIQIDRYTPYRTASYVKLGNFTAITGDTTQELQYYATEKEFGTRCRFKFTTSGTWTVTNVKVYCTIFMRNR